jgi:hypothetical protein
MEQVFASGNIFMFHVYHQRVFPYAKTTKHFHFILFLSNVHAMNVLISWGEAVNSVRGGPLEK